MGIYTKEHAVKTPAIVDEVPPKTHVEAAPAVQVTNVVTTEVVPLGPRIHGDYPTTTSKALGCVQIIFGVVDVILALWRMFTLENRSTPYLIALTGITFILGGATGVRAGRSKTEQAIKSYRVISGACVGAAAAKIMGILVWLIVDLVQPPPEIRFGHETERVVIYAIFLALGIVAGITFLWSRICVAGKGCRFSPTANTQTTHTAIPTVTTHTAVAAEMKPAPYSQQPEMLYAYNGPAQLQYGAPMPPQPAQPVQPPQYGAPPESFEKLPPYVALINIS